MAHCAAVTQSKAPSLAHTPARRCRYTGFVLKAIRTFVFETTCSFFFLILKKRDLERRLNVPSLQVKMNIRLTLRPKLAAWCKSMQVNILLDFTKITMHVLQGQVASHQKKGEVEKKIPLLFPAGTNGSFFFHPVIWWWKCIPLFRLTCSIVQVISVFWSSSSH